MALANASKIGLLLRRAKDGYLAIRAQMQDYETTFSAGDAPDLITWAQQRATWEDELIDDSQLRDLRAEWDDFARKNLDAQYRQISSWKRQCDAALQGAVYTAQDAPSVDDTTDAILEHLARQMSQSGEAVKACTVSMTLPTANASNHGNPYISASLIQSDWMPGTGTVQNEAIYSMAISMEYSTASRLVVGLECSNSYDRDVAGFSPGDTTINIIQDTDGDALPTGTADGDNIVVDSMFQGKSTTSRVLLHSTSGGLSGEGSNWALSSAQAYLDLMSLKITSSATASAYYYLGTYTGTPCLGNTNSYLYPATATLEPDTVYYLSAMAYTAGLSAGAIRMQTYDSTGGTQSLLSWTGSGDSAWTRDEAYFRTPTAMSSDARLVVVASGANTSAFIDAIRLAKTQEHGGIQWAPSTYSKLPVEGDRWDGGSTTNNVSGHIQWFLRDNYGVMLTSSASPSTNFDD